VRRENKKKKKKKKKKKRKREREKEQVYSNVNVLDLNSRILTSSKSQDLKKYYYFF